MRLHARIYLHSLAVLVIACVATAAAFALGSRAALMQELGERVARHLAADIADVIQEPDALTQRLRRLHDELGVTLIVRDREHRVVATTGPPVARGWTATAAIRDRATGAVLGALEASTPRPFGPLHLLRPGAVVLLILVVVALVTILTTRRISRPLERLTRAVRRLGGGELATRVPLEQPGRGRWRHRRRHDELKS